MNNGGIEPLVSFHEPIARATVSQGAPSTSLSNASDFDDRIDADGVEMFKDLEVCLKKTTNLKQKPSVLPFNFPPNTYPLT
jgi:hypothetical protein